MPQGSANAFWSSPLSLWGFRALALVVATVAAYANSFAAAFQFDDFPAIVENPAIRDLSAFAHLTRPTGEYPLLLIRPRWVGDLSFALDYRLWGLDVRGYHLTNLLIHLAAALMVYRLGVLLLRAPRLAAAGERANAVAWFAAAAFALHPLQTQAVTYVVQRYASLATLFALIAAVGWFEARGRWGRRQRASAAILYLLALLASALAMLTKEMVATFPVLLALADLLLFDGRPARRLAAWAPLGATSGLVLAGVLGGRPVLERLSAAGAATSTVMGMSHLDFLLTEARVVATYLRLAVWPTGQNLFWDYPIEHSLASAGVLTAVGLLAGLVLAALLLWRWRRAPPELRVVSWGIFWFLGALTVESGAVLIIDVINEHRVYYPSVGLFIGASVGLASLADWGARRHRVEPRVAAGLGLVVLVAFGVATFQRNAIWRTGVTLWADVAAKSPRLPGPLFMLGLSWEREQGWEQAAAAYRSALAADPGYSPARMGLRAMCMKLGRRDCVLHAAATLAFLGGDSAQALALWQQGLKANPMSPEIHYGLGLALEKTGEAVHAQDEFEFACRLGSSGACATLKSGDRAIPGA